MGIKKCNFREIREDIRDQKVSVIADETFDVGHHEQLSIVLQYIPRNSDRPIESLVAL